MLEPIQVAGWAGSKGRAQTRHRLRWSAGGWDSACPSLSFWSPEIHVHPASPQAQGHWRRHARETCCRKSRSGDNQPPAHSPSAGTRPRAATASPTSGRRSIRDRPQDYVTAARRPTGTYRRAAWLRRPSTQSTSAGHSPPVPADIKSPSPAPPTPY